MYYISLFFNFFFFFFFNDTATTEIYTLSLHDALPIEAGFADFVSLTWWGCFGPAGVPKEIVDRLDRKSTRLNSSHVKISYAVFCLKKKKKNIHIGHPDLISITR